jgi:Kef-type K+ transport system membrane component KefB
VLAVLVSISEKFGLDMILGAFTAGMVVSLGSRERTGVTLHHRLEAIGYGFLIPMFFVTSGMHFQVGALMSSPKAMLRLPLFLLLLLVARSTPTLLYRYELAKEDHLPFAFYSATSLPLLIAIAEIGVRSGRMLPENAAALVGAGMLSILLFPIVALMARDRTRRSVSDAGIDSQETI